MSSHLPFPHHDMNCLHNNGHILGDWWRLLLAKQFLSFKKKIWSVSALPVIKNCFICFFEQRNIPEKAQFSKYGEWYF